MEHRWPEIDVDRLRAVQELFARLAARSYDMQRMELEVAGKISAAYWMTEAETLTDPAGAECRDKAAALVKELLAIGREAVLLAIVDSGQKKLAPYAQIVDGELLLVPGVDHATLLWIPGADPSDPLQVNAARHAEDRAEQYDLDPTWDRVVPWAESGHTCLWTWGLEGGVGVWRSHFERKPYELPA